MQHVMPMTAYTLATRYIGIKEFAGSLDNPVIMAMLKLTSDGQWNGWPEHDEVPWCSAFANWIAWNLHLPRSKSLLARSWLGVGIPIDLEDAMPMNDVLIFKRGGGSQPGPDNMTAPGHVGFFGRVEGSKIWTLGGNQSNMVSVAPYPKKNLLGVRRIYGPQAA